MCLFDGPSHCSSTHSTETRNLFQVMDCFGAESEVSTARSDRPRRKSQTKKSAKKNTAKKASSESQAKITVSSTHTSQYSVVSLAGTARSHMPIIANVGNISSQRGIGYNGRYTSDTCTMRSEIYYVDPQPGHMCNAVTGRPAATAVCSGENLRTNIHRYIDG